MANGAYIDSDGWLVLPNTNSSAYVDIRWDKAGNQFYLKGTAYATIDDSYVHFSPKYLDANKVQLSSNGYANKITLNTNYSFSTAFGGSNQYGDAIVQSTYIRLSAVRSTSYAKNEYKIKDIYVGPTNVAYTPFVPNKPSPDYPSEINSVGTYNSTTRKYDVNIEVNHGNLFKNGYGELENNTNFTSWIYNNESSSIPRKSFSITSGAYLTLKSNDLNEIDINKDYEISMWSKNNGKPTKYYIGFTSFDIDKREISPVYNMYISNTLTTLARELKNGDTVVYLTSNQNFKTASDTPKYQRGLIFWNYKDSTNYEYPENTYSRNVWTELYTYDNIFKTSTIKDGVTYPANTIKLISAWNKGTIPAGTKVSQSADGGTFNYSLLSNAFLNTNWTYYSNIISGIEYSGQNNSLKFRPGTKYVKFLSLDNSEKKANSSTYYSGIKFIEKEKKEITYSLNQPLRSLPDGTKDKLVIDNVNKKVYVERSIGYKELNGAENWGKNSGGNANNGRFQAGGVIANGVNTNIYTEIKNILSSHFNNYGNEHNMYLGLKENAIGLFLQTASTKYIGINMSSIVEVSAFKSYLASEYAKGTPVTVQYKLATPVIEELPYQEVQNYDGRSDVILNNLTQPSNIETIYLKKQS